MKLPGRYLDLLLSDRDPGEAYRLCLQEMAAEGRALDYAATEALVYAVEVRYALEVLRSGRPPRWRNFAHLTGAGDARLWEVLDALPLRSLAFVGSGPFPVTALLLRDRYPDVPIQCVDDQVVAHLLACAVAERAGAHLDLRLAEGAEVDYSGFTAVVVAAMVTDQPRVVERVLESSDALCILRGRVPLEHPRLIHLDRAGGFGATGHLDLGHRK